MDESTIRQRGAKIDRIIIEVSYLGVVADPPWQARVDCMVTPSKNRLAPTDTKIATIAAARDATASPIEHQAMIRE